MKAGWHPRIKPEHGLDRATGDRVRVGGAVFGIAAEVVDRTGAVWTMLEAADGNRSVTQIVDTVRHKHPDETPDAVRHALDALADEGYLEDATATRPDGLSAREITRYDRGMRFFRWLDLTARESPWEPQLRLKRSRVVVIGLGGTGGAVATALAASGVGWLHCVDGDRVELSNLNRQVTYRESDVGRSKVDACVERLRQLNTDISVTGERCAITGEPDLRRLADDHDLLVLCADRPGEIRAWANRACLDSATPWVDAGYHGPQITATAYVPGQGACYECNWLSEVEFHRQTHPDRQYSVHRASVDAATAVSAGLSGYLAAHVAIALITGVGAVEPGTIQGVNLAAVDHHVLLRNGRHPDCPACGGR
ncbi:MAG: HesA/MoeB/ThiF family protein [Betaproteobacteria bacterium]